MNQCQYRLRETPNSIGNRATVCSDIPSSLCLFSEYLCAQSWVEYKNTTVPALWGLTGESGPSLEMDGAQADERCDCVCLCCTQLL